MSENSHSNISLSQQEPAGQVGGTAQGTPAVTTQPGGTEVAAPGVLTPEQILIAKQVADIIINDPTANRSFKKSLFDHTDARVTQGIDAKVKELQGLGLTVTPEARVKIEETVTQSLQAAQPEDKSAQLEIGGHKPTLDPTIVAADQKVDALIQKYGFDLDPADELAKPVKAAALSKDPFAFVAAYEVALQKTAELRKVAGSLSQAPSSGTSGSGTGNESKESLIKELETINANLTPQGKIRAKEIVDTLTARGQWEGQ
jgi:hypothetical protein